MTAALRIGRAVNAEWRQADLTVTGSVAHAGQRQVTVSRDSHRAVARYHADGTGRAALLSHGRSDRARIAQGVLTIARGDDADGAGVDRDVAAQIGQRAEAAGLSLCDIAVQRP